MWYPNTPQNFVYEVTPITPDDCQGNPFLIEEAPDKMSVARLY